MKIRVTPKTAGNVVNIRAGMSGKKMDVIVDTLPDGFECDAVETTNDSFLKIDTGDIKGFIRSELVTIIPTEVQVELPTDEETDPAIKEN